MSTFRRPIDNAESLRSTRRSLGDGTVTGRSRLAMPPQNKARGTGLQRLTGPPGVSGVSTGETITVAATSVAISTTPTLVTFTQEVGERAGFFFSAPSPDVQPTFGDAYYDIQVSIDRGGYSGTVAVEVLRGNDVVWGPTFDPYWNNPTHPVSAKGRLVDPAISPWRVRLTGDGSGTLARVTVQVELVDRPRLTPDVIPDPIETRLGYGLTKLDSSGTISLTLVPGNLDIEEGDILLFGLGATYQQVSGSAPESLALTVDANLALLHQFPISNTASPDRRRATGGFWWRRATANDVNSVNNYTATWGPIVGNASAGLTFWVAAIGGYGTVGNPFGTVNSVWNENNNGETLAVAAPGGGRTLVGTFGVRNSLTVPSFGEWEHTPLTPELTSRYFWIGNALAAPTTGQSQGFDSSIGDNPGSRRIGIHRVLTAESNVGAQVRFGESYTHTGLMAVAVNM